METSHPPGSHSSSPLLDPAQVETALSACAHQPTLSRLRRALEPAQLYLVGGLVRDAFWGSTETDIDVACDLAPSTVAARCVRAGIRTIDTGLQHGTVLALVDGVHIEVTTFRQPTDRETHAAASTIEVDLSGRDFTINAIAFCLERERLVDPFGGIQDLKSNLVRAVGDPQLRLREDPLRILRMVRFGSASGRDIDAPTLAAANALAPSLNHVSVERIKSELDRILLSQHPDEGVRMLYAIGALPYTIPELLPAVGFQQNRYHVHDVFEHTMSVLARTPADLILRWSAIFHDIGKPHTLSVDDRGERHFYLHEVVSDRLCRERMQLLKFSRADSSAIATIVQHHMRPLDCGPAGVRRIIRDLGDHLSRWRTFKEADASPTQPKAQFDAVAQQFDALLLKEQERLATPALAKLAVNGNDILGLGVPAGPMVGTVLSELSELVLNDPERNTREVLLAEAQRIIAGCTPLNGSSSY